MDKRIHQAERIDLWLQVVVEHRLESSHLWVHNHDVLRDAVVAKRDALVSYGYGKIVDTMLLKRFGNLHSTSTVGISLHHADELRLWFQE